MPIARPSTRSPRRPPPLTFRALADIADLGVRGLPPDEVARHLARRFRALLRGGSAAVYRIDRGRKELVLDAFAAGRRPVDWAPRLPLGSGIVGAAIRRRCATAAPGALADERPRRRGPSAPARPSAHAHRAQLAVPLRSGARVIGALAVAAPTGRRFSDIELAQSAAFADQASIALGHAARLATGGRARQKALRLASATGQRRRALSAALIAAQEAERRHIARELHDEVGQALTATHMNLAMLKETTTGAAARRRIDESMATVARILRAIRRLSLDLHPPALDDLGLVAALRSHASRQAEPAGLALALTLDELPAPLPASVAIACFRVAQEAITNVVRHARASRLTVGLACDTRAIALTIRDDGGGFDIAQARRRALAGGSLGLLGMEERAALAGGTVEIRSQRGRGTELHARFPLVPPPPRPASPEYP